METTSKWFLLGVLKDQVFEELFTVRNIVQALLLHIRSPSFTLIFHDQCNKKLNKFLKSFSSKWKNFKWNQIPFVIVQFFQIFDYRKSFLGMVVNFLLHVCLNKEFYIQVLKNNLKNTAPRKTVELITLEFRSTEKINFQSKYYLSLILMECSI